MQQTNQQQQDKTKLLKKIQHAQEERARVYNEFASAFKQYLKQPTDSNAAKNYTNTCQTITSEYQRISASVREVEQQFLNNESTVEFASLIRQLQLQEKEKLETTIAIQKVQREMVLEKDRLKNEESHECSLGCKVDHEVIRGEKLAYLENDFTKFQIHMTKIIEQISEIMDTIRFEIYDLEDQNE